MASFKAQQWHFLDLLGRQQWNVRRCCSVQPLKVERLQTMHNEPPVKQRKTYKMAFINSCKTIWKWRRPANPEALKLIGGNSRCECVQCTGGKRWQVAFQPAACICTCISYALGPIYLFLIQDPYLMLKPVCVYSGFNQCVQQTGGGRGWQVAGGFSAGCLSLYLYLYLNPYFYNRWVCICTVARR